MCLLAKSIFLAGRAFAVCGTAVAFFVPVQTRKRIAVVPYYCSQGLSHTFLETLRPIEACYVFGFYGTWEALTY